MSRFIAPAPAQESGARAPSPTFSVIIAAYEAADTIGEAIESALGQTSPPHEIVVCDDGSTDDLATALAPYEDRVGVIRQENRGEAAAKNAAARAATGDFVVILDADDVFLPERLERIAELAEARPDLDIITTDAVLELNGRPVRRCYEESFPFPAVDQEREILRRNFVFGLAAVRRELLLADGGFNESVRFTTDWERWIRLLLAGSRVGLCSEVLARYRLEPGSLSGQRSRMLEGRIATLTLSQDHPALDDEGRGIVADTIAKFERELLVMRAREALVAGDPDARRHAWRAARAGSLPAGVRVKAAVCAATPGVAGSALRRRPSETTAGLLRPPAMSVRGKARGIAARLVRNLPPARRLRIALAAAELAREAAGRQIAVLDAGCEVGLLTERLARRHPGWSIRAIDINNEWLGIARERAREQGLAGVSFARVDMTRDDPERGFDVVAAIECLAEIGADDAAARFLADSARPGGLVVVHVPERDWRPVLRGSPAAWKGEQRHGYTADEIAAKLRAAGLEVVSVRPTTHALVHLVQELRERLKSRGLRYLLPLYPLAALAVASERAGLRPGAPRALFVTARRPAAEADAPTPKAEAHR